MAEFERVKSKRLTHCADCKQLTARDTMRHASRSLHSRIVCQRCYARIQLERRKALA